MVHLAWYMVHGAWCMVHGAWCKAPVLPDMQFVGSQSPRKNLGSHIDASHSRQPLVKGERLVRYEVNAVMLPHGTKTWIALWLNCQLVSDFSKLEHQPTTSPNREI